MYLPDLAEALQNVNIHLGFPRVEPKREVAYEVIERADRRVHERKVASRSQHQDRLGPALQRHKSIVYRTQRHSHRVPRLTGCPLSAVPRQPH